MDNIRNKMSNWALDIGDWGQWYCRYLPFRYFFLLYIYIYPPRFHWISLWVENPLINWLETFGQRAYRLILACLQKKFFFFLCFEDFFSFDFFLFGLEVERVERVSVSRMLDFYIPNPRLKLASGDFTYSWASLVF